MELLPKSHKGTWILFLLAAILCVLRFLDLDSAPFINDEPRDQLILDWHIRTHTFPVLGLRGTHGVCYGPTALWLYYPIRLVTNHINALVAYFAALSVVGFSIIIATTWKSAGKEIAAWMAAFIASSPYLFFYSRLPWDVTFLLLLVSLMCFFVVRLDCRHTYADWALMGLLSGLIVDLHLMALPILAAGGLTLAPTLLKRLKGSKESQIATIKGLVIGTVILCVVVAPYFSAVWQDLASGHHFDLTMPNFGSGFTYTPRFLSWSGMSYFLEGTKEAHELVFSGLLSRAYSWDPSILLKIAGWMLLATTGWKLAKRQGQVPAIQRMAFFSFALLMIYYGGIDLDMNHPHYFLPIWWVMFFFAALAIIESKGILHGVMTAAGAMTIAMNIVFVLAAHAWIVEKHGTRGAHYSTVHSELEKIVNEICDDVTKRHGKGHAAIPVLLETHNVIGIRPFPIEYYFRHEPNCVGRVISTEIVPSAVPGLDRYSLSYKNPEDELSAALSWRYVD